ncbi:MAG: HypC/HybG/HupF family hydrogenase formation chaperone [Thiohalomonadaceae bacterium]
MCLAIPARVVAVDQDGGTAVVSVSGVKKEVSTALVADVAIDDYLLIHVGFALNKISEEEAERTLALFAQAALGGTT